jgi:hydrogenase nickel incorporation protein HypA/HybF
LHEMSIAKNLFDIVAEAARREAADGRVEAIDLRIGKLRAVIPANLEFCFEVITRSTILEGAKLRIVEIPVNVLCEDCGETSEMNDPIFACAHCGSVKLDLISGKELEISSFEISDPTQEEQQ